MSGDEVSAALDQLKISRLEFANLVNSDARRVKRWTKSEEPPPHWAMLMLCLMSLPGALPLARGIFSRQYEKKPDQVEEVDA